MYNREKASWTRCPNPEERNRMTQGKGIVEKGVIEKVIGNVAMIRVMKTGGCAGCTEKDACHMRFGGQKPMIVDVDNDLGARAGDWVELSMPALNVVKLSFIVYFLPVLALVVAAAVGAELAHFLNLTRDVASLLFGGATLLISFLLLKRLNRNIRKNRQYYPRMTRIVAGETCEKGAV